ELAEIARDQEKVKIMELELKDIFLALQKLQEDDAPTATVQKYEAQLQDMAKKIIRLSNNAKNKATAFPEVRALTAQHLALQARLDLGGLARKEIDQIVREMDTVNDKLETQQFEVNGGGTSEAFMEFLATNRRREISTMMSRLADGGLNPDDKSSLE